MIKSSKNLEKFGIIKKIKKHSQNITNTIQSKYIIIFYKAYEI
ncbi:hypothetical protein FN3523_1824 [Francisella hispaniensis]|uniref:Uncharacterized protein n=1 Tax=Francisella hispaniensis TaxID=622488 RepID=F4BI33_9GAMM|nr:hypothetical protein FN3523_1824 [Francisella hispaniensis]